MDLILKFFKAKWIFVKPKPRKILIYDRQGSQHLLNYLKKMIVLYMIAGVKV